MCYHSSADSSRLAASFALFALSFPKRPLEVRSLTELGSRTKGFANWGDRFPGQDTIQADFFIGFAVS